MAERQSYLVPVIKRDIGFTNIHLLKSQSLGIGSYGAVCKAKCDDLICAAKIIHPTLVAPTPEHIAPEREHRLPLRRFEQECEFMSAIRHPNIIQYLGMFRDPDTGLPALLMELMDDSLTHFLESSTHTIPYHIQVNICHDITLALSFLHSNKIIHRDLSSNNILLMSNARAKITDFGMARFGELCLGASDLTLTVCPGTDVFMPPEAVQNRTAYTEKVDCFSFGVITVQILTRVFPKPSERHKSIEITDVHFPHAIGRVEIRVPEIERRQNHIQKISSNHPLLPISLDCLKDDDIERPSAQQLCGRLASLKDTLQYKESQQGTQVSEEELGRNSFEDKAQKFQEVQQKDNLLKEKDQIISANDNEIQKLRMQLQEADKVAKEREKQTACVRQQLEECEQVIAQLVGRIAELEQEISHSLPRPQISSVFVEASRKEEVKGSKTIKLRWRKAANAPSNVVRWSDAVVDSNMVYIRGGDTQVIYAYDTLECTWSELPFCMNDNYSIAVINGLLTTVGGYRAISYSNQLFSLTGEGTTRRWIEKFPPMPTKRRWTTALTSGKFLIVAGGSGEKGVNLKLSTVEIMNTETFQWSTAASLPEPLVNASAAICGNSVYLLGGKNISLNSTKSVYTCTVSALLRSCRPQSLGQWFKKALSSSSQSNIWSSVANVPVTSSTCLSFHDQLLAIGGSDAFRRATPTVHMYNPTTYSWEPISHMLIPRHQCYAAVLPDNQLMIVGGYTDTYGRTNTTEIATLV